MVVGSQVPTYQDAESLRKSGKHAEACELFAQLWRQNPSPFVGWRYAFCLRKVGQWADAEKIAREALAKYPEDVYTKSELGWIILEKDLKPSVEEGDLGRAVHVANQIVALNPSKMALAKAVLEVMKAAKKRENWEILLAWADRLTPGDLRDQPIVVNGKRGMSDRETWYCQPGAGLVGVATLC
jgi:tetratricopeptide (TPR) repeat protein